jgi:hypothetical protein
MGEEFWAFVQKIMNNVEVNITQAEAAFRLLKLTSILKQFGLEGIPQETEVKEKITQAYYMSEHIDMKTRELPSGKVQPKMWIPKHDCYVWVPTYEELKEAVAGLKEQGIVISGLSDGKN